jgi:hypothetical protein
MKIGLSRGSAQHLLYPGRESAEGRPDVKDNQLVFPPPPTIDDWWTDLAAAKADVKDDMGRKADFHVGTRKTLCIRMHRSSVPWPRQCAHLYVLIVGNVYHGQRVSVTHPKRRIRR